MRTETELPTQRQAEAQRKLEDLKDLINLGESPLLACAHVGWTPAAAARQAYRQGRKELASIITCAAGEVYVEMPDSWYKGGIGR